MEGFGNLPEVTQLMRFGAGFEPKKNWVPKYQARRIGRNILKKGILRAALGGDWDYQGE